MGSSSSAKSITTMLPATFDATSVTGPSPVYAAIPCTRDTSYGGTGRRKGAWAWGRDGGVQELALLCCVVYCVLWRYMVHGHAIGQSNSIARSQMPMPSDRGATVAEDEKHPVDAFFASARVAMIHVSSICARAHLNQSLTPS